MQNPGGSWFERRRSMGEGEQRRGFWQVGRPGRSGQAPVSRCEAVVAVELGDDLEIRADRPMVGAREKMIGDLQGLVETGDLQVNEALRRVEPPLGDRLVDGAADHFDAHLVRLGD